MLGVSSEPYFLLDSTMVSSGPRFRKRGCSHRNKEGQPASSSPELIRAQIEMAFMSVLLLLENKTSWGCPGYCLLKNKGLNQEVKEFLFKRFDMLGIQRQFWNLIIPLDGKTYMICFFKKKTYINKERKAWHQSFSHISLQFLVSLCFFIYKKKYFIIVVATVFEFLSSMYQSFFNFKLYCVRRVQVEVQQTLEIETFQTCISIIRWPVFFLHFTFIRIKCEWTQPPLSFVQETFF